MIVGAVIVRQYSKFRYYDIFGIRNQIKTTIRVLLLGIFVLLMIDIMLAAIGRQDLLFIWCIVAIGSTLGVSYLEVVYVIKKNNKYSNCNNNKNTNTKNDGIFKRICKCCEFCRKSSIEKTTKNVEKHMSDHKKQHAEDALSQMDSNTKTTHIIASINCDDNINQFKQTIKFMTHWSQVVSTSVGYELFINHLAKEFSVETMLFSTEVCICIV